MSLEFDPKNRRKVFQKSVRVITNAAQREVVLRVSGFIVPDDSALNKRVGQLRVNRAEFNFNNVFDNEEKRDSIVVMNNSGHVMKLRFEQEELPENIAVWMDEETIAPRETAMIYGKIRGDKEGKYGFSRYRVNFYDEAYPDSTRGQIIISSNQQENFGAWTNEEKNRAAQIRFLNKSSIFGDKTSGEKVECSFRFENTGKSDLKIRDIRLPSHISVVRYDEVVGASGWGEIILEVNTERISGDLIRYVTVTTNAPSASQIRLNIEGKVIDRK